MRMRKNGQKYRSTIKTMSFLYPELRKVAILCRQGFTLDDIRQKALRENIFLLNTENRIKKIAATVLERVGVLDDYLIGKITDGNLATSKQLALYAILKTDRLFFEFMLEVYREKHILKDYIITDKDINVFFRHKAEQSKRVASWSDYTIYKMGQVYKRILIESGFAKKNSKSIEITRPIIENEIASYLKKTGNHIYLKAMLGEA